MISKMFGSEEKILLLFSVIVTPNKQLKNMLLISTRCYSPIDPGEGGGGVETTPQVRWYTFINERGFYALIFGSKKEFASKFQDLLQSSHLSVNMANINCLIDPGIR